MGNPVLHGLSCKLLYHASICEFLIILFSGFQQQDLLSKRVSIGHAVKQTWHGPASDTPKDIRARQFTLAFRDDFPETEKFIARTDPQIVFRAEFHCAGTHNRCDDEPPSAADLADAIDHLEYSDDDEPWDGMSDNAEQADVDENPDPAPDPKETPKEAKDQRRTRCTGNSRTCVQYHVSTNIR